MKKFVALYHAPAEALAQMANATPEQKMEGMKPWMAWKEKVGSGIVDLGAPLFGGQSISKGGQWGGSSKEVSGYSIVQGESLEAAQALFEDHPHLNWHPAASIELHELAPM